MPTTTRTVFLTDENGNPLIDAQRNMRTLSFSLVQGYSYRLVERASIVSATYEQIVGYSTATGQTITGVENASKFDVGDFGIVQYAISDRNNTIGYVTCEVTAVGTDSLTVNGIGISVAGADGAPGADGKDGTPGAAATVSVGQVTTLPAGSQATVTNSGDENAAVLNFGIPQGATGQTGANGTDGQDGVGIQNIAADGQDENGGNIYRITLTNGQSYTFVAPKGATGNTGAPGADGQDGADGASGVTSVTAGTPTQSDGYTVTPLTFNFEQGNSATVNVSAKNGESGGGGTPVIDLGTVTIADNTGTVNITSEQMTSFLSDSPPSIKFTTSDGMTVSLSRVAVLGGEAAIFAGVMVLGGTTMAIDLLAVGTSGTVTMTEIAGGGGGGGLQSTKISIGELDTLSSIISQIAGISSSHSIVAIVFSPAQYGGATTFPIFMLDIGAPAQFIFVAKSCSPLAGGGFVFSGTGRMNNGSSQPELGYDLMIKSNGNINLFVYTTETDSMPVTSASSYSASIFDLVVYYQ